MQQQERKHVAIIGYESAQNPFVQTAIDMLTQGIRERGLSLGTYIWVHNASQKDEYDDNHTDSLTLTDHAGYLKKMISNTDQLRGLPADLMIIRCHGSARRNGHCAQLTFFDQNAPTQPYKQEYVVHSRQESTNISLKELTSNTNLVLLLTCFGNQIMTDYLSQTNTQPRPFILVSNQNEILSASVDIILLVLFNILEFVDFGMEPVYKSQFWGKFLAAIMKLFQVVKLFGDDHASFWKYLQHTGVITLDEQRSIRHQLPWKKPEGPRLFQLYGRSFSYIVDENTMQYTLRDFKSLLLVRPDGPPDSADTAADIELSTDENVDVYLRSYKAEREAKLRATPPPAARARRDMTLEYNDVALPAPVHDVPLDEMPAESAFCAPSADILRMRACLCKGLSLKKASN